MKTNEINLRDPFVLAENGKYYLYGTGKNAWGGPAEGFDVFVSDDLSDWTKKRVFSPGGFWSEENYWAPEVHKIGGKYVMFAAFWSKTEGRRVHLLTCDAPDGTFVPLPSPLTPAGMECLDATYFEEGGRKWTVFCHEWTQVKDGEMMLAPLSDDLKMGEPRLLFRASEAPWTKGFGDGCYVTDGPCLYRLKKGLLMLWSSHAEGGYATGMSVAESIEGPWRHLEEPLLSGGAGHAMIFFENGAPMLAFHAPDEPHGSERPVFLPLEEGEGRLFLKHGMLP